MKKLICRFFLTLVMACSIGWYCSESLAFETTTILWIDGKYIDNFGELTQKGYVTTYPIISGRFSNSAVQDARLNVTFLIDKENIAIQLYEYAGNNPVKTYSAQKYEVFIRNKDGRSELLKAINRSDRMVFIEIDRRILHKILAKGGIIDFYIKHSEYLTNYKFTIKSVQPKEVGSYAKAYKALN